MIEKEIKILVADDTPVNVKIIQKFLEPKGFEVIIAENGAEAVEKYAQSKPDIILMDVMMPVKDGYEATQEIKKLAGNKWVPVLFLSAKSSVEDQIQGINLGGDDYLTKPVDLNMLEVKLKAMMRIVEMQRKLNSATEKLRQFADRASEEIDLAKNLMRRMGERKENVDSDEVNVFAEAAEDISGDIALSYQCKNPAQRYFILADATGHGLTAAISLVPLSQLFYYLAGEGETVSEIARQINMRLHAILPPNRFVAASVAFIDQDQKTIDVWNGSNPLPYLVSNSGRLLHTFSKPSFSLGVVGENEFSPESDIFHYEEPCELLLFSDGVIDAKNASGEIFSKQRIAQVIDSGLNEGELMFDKIKDTLNQFRDHENKVDDICLLSVRCH